LAAQPGSPESLQQLVEIAKRRVHQVPPLGMEAVALGKMIKQG